jgi:hypothetical protein
LLGIKSSAIFTASLNLIVAIAIFGFIKFGGKNERN